MQQPKGKNMSLEKWSQNHLEGLLKHDVLTETPEFLIRVDLGQYLRIYLSSKFSGDAAAAGVRTKL